MPPVKTRKCVSCPKLIGPRSTRCNSCSVRAKWANPALRAKTIAAIKAVQPARERPFCAAGCGVRVKSLRAKKCRLCAVRAIVHPKLGPRPPHVIAKVGAAIRRAWKDEKKRAKWLHALRKRSDGQDWKKKQKDGAAARSKKGSWKTNHASMVARVTKTAEWREVMVKNSPCWRQGSDHPSWKLDAERVVRMMVPGYRVWQRRVFKRDKRVCQKCGQVGGRLHAHHIKSWLKHPDLRVDVSNGVTLCLECHLVVHGKGTGKRWKKKHST